MRIAFESNKSCLVVNTLLVVGLLAVSSLNIFAQQVERRNVQATLYKSYDAFKSDEASLIIDQFRTEVANHANSRGFVIVYCGKVCQYGEVEAHLRGLQLSFHLKHVDMTQFFLIVGGFKERTTTEFWLVPDGAALPTVNSTVNFESVRYKGTFNSTIVQYECCLESGWQRGR
jgi:hypothetical protein